MNKDELLITHLSRKSVIVFFAKTFNFLAVFGAVIILARLLSQELFGRYQQCWLIINTVVPVLILGAPQGLNFLLPQASTSLERAFICWRFYLLIIFAGAIFLLLLFLFPSLPAADILQNPKLIPLLKPVALFIFFLLPGFCLESLLIINERPWLLLIVNAIYALFFLVIHIVFAYLSALEPLFIFLALLAVGKTFFTFLFTQRTYPLKVPSPESRLPGRILNPFEFKRLAIYTGTLTVIALLDVLTVQIDKYLVLWFYKGAEKIFAIYSVGAVEIPLVGLVLGAVSSVTMPEFSRLLAKAEKKQVLLLLQQMTERLNLLFSPIFFYLLFSGFVLIPFLFGERYRPAASVFSIYLFLIPLRIFNNHPLLIASGLQRLALYGRIIDVVANVTLGLILLPWLGYFAPAISTVIATYFHKFYQVAVLQRFLNTSWRQLYPWRKILNWMGRIAVISFFAVYLINKFITPPLLSLILSAILFPLSLLFLLRSRQYSLNF